MNFQHRIPPKIFWEVLHVQPLRYGLN